LATAGIPSLGRTGDTPGFASPKEAMKAAPEKLLFVICNYANTGIDKPDYLAVVDADPTSKTYSQVVHRVSMPKPGDKLHHFGWNICPASQGKRGARRYLIVPGLKSSDIHIIDAKDPLNLKLHRTIQGNDIRTRLDLSAPHTVHCLADETVV